MRFLGLALMVFLTLNACGENKSDANAATTAGVVSLEGKRPEEVLALKYRKADLNCELRTQAGSAFDPVAIPTARISWNLLKDFASARHFELRGSADPKHSFKMDLAVTEVRIDGLSQYRDVDGTVYQMEYSPTLVVTYRYEGSLQLSSGISSRGSGEGTRNVRERILNRVLSMSETDTSAALNVEFFTEVRCSLDTEIRPEYSGQFLMKKPN